MARFLTAPSIQRQKMSPKTVFRQYFSKRYVAYKGQHKITLTNTRIMSQICLVQHVNMFPFSLALDFFLRATSCNLFYSDEFSHLEKAKLSEKVSII